MRRAVKRAPCVVWLWAVAPGLMLSFACSGAPKPLPDGQPPTYQPPREYFPKTNIDHVPGEVTRPPR
jgi:hypothetical protein